jgi:hypothetical protein
MDMDRGATDLLVETHNPQRLDETLNQFGAVLIGGGMPGGYVKHEGYYVARVFGNVGFIKFMLDSQGYGRVIRELDELI